MSKLTSRILIVLIVLVLGWLFFAFDLHTLLTLESLKRQQHEIEQFYADYVDQHRVLCRAAIELMIRGRMEMGVAAHPFMDSTSLSDSRHRALYEELLKNSGQRSSLIADTAGAIEAQLTDSMRREMRRALRTR